MVLKNIHKTQSLLMVIILAIIAIVSFNTVFSGESRVEAAPNSYLNFQARIKNSTGGLIADGNYNLEFKMYSASSGGSALWTETRSGGNRVRVVNGYMSVSLGSVNALPGSIDWGEEYWITMNIGGTGGVASWDGEMNPRLQLTAVPSAFHARTASGLTDGTSSFTANDFVKVSPNATQSINSANAAININQTGSGSVLQLQSGGTSVMTINNSGNTVFNNVSNSTTAFSLQNAAGTSLFSLDTTNSRVRIGNPTADAVGTTLILDTKNTAGDPTGLNGAMYYNSNTGKFRCYEGGAWKDCISSGATGAVIVGGNTLGAAMTLGTNDAYALNFETSGVTQASISSNGATLFKNSTNSNNAFSIQNAAGSYLFNANTTDRKVTISGNTVASMAFDWDEPTSTMDGSGWRSIAYGMGRFVAVAESGSNRVMYSIDGSSWTAVVGSTAHTWTSVAYGNGVFVAVGQGGASTARIMRSIDGGVTWSVVTTSGSASNGDWSALTYGNGVFVAVSSSGARTNMVSTDGGLTWTGYGSISGYNWYDVAYGDGKFVAITPSVGDARFVTSADGITWSSVTAIGSSSGNWRSISYGGGMFVIASMSGSSGSPNNIFTSTDGAATWTPRSTGEGGVDWGDWVSMAYGNGIFISVGQAGDNRAISSSDGITWTPGTSVNSIAWRDVAYGNGVFVAVASSGTNRVMVADEIVFGNAALDVSGNSRFNGNLIVGNADEKADLLVLDNYYTAVDPRGTDGAMYYNSNTGKFRCYQNDGWTNCIGAGVASVTKVVAPSGASAGVKAASHFVAAGTQSDEDAINAAIASLPATGGNVRLLDGDYVIDGAINVTSNVTISGTGKATRVALKPSTSAAVNMFYVSGRSNVVIKDLRIDGQRASQATNNHNGIYVTNSGSGTGNSATQGISINNTMIVNLSANGIYFNDSDNNHITNNIFTNNQTSITVTYLSDYNKISGNTINGGTDYGIFMTGGSKYNTINNNTIYGGGVGLRGIHVSEAHGSTITSNSLSGITSGYGITVDNSNSVAVSSNAIDSNGDTTRSIYVTNGGTDTVIEGNKINRGRVDVSNGSNVLQVSVINNTIYLSSSATAILLGTAAQGAYLDGNNFSSVGSISDSGTGTVYGPQQNGGANGNIVVDPRGTGSLEVRGTVIATLGAADTGTAVCYNSSNQLAGCTSSSRFKDNVAELELGMDELNLLQPVSYTWNTNGKNDIGFIAEQVAAVIPQAVEYDLNGEVSTFNYHTISALLVASTQELSVKVDGINGRLSSVENRLNALEQNTANNPINLSIANNLVVGANITVGGKIITSGNAPTVTVNANAGDGAQSAVLGNDTSGVVTVDSGAFDVVAGEQVSVTFHSPYAATPKITITPSTESSAKVRYYVEQDQNGFKILFIDVPELAKRYSFNYWIAQ